MPRLLPRSLQGQMLLAVALALLVAQALSAVLLYRAEQQRQESTIVNGLAFQLVAEPRDREARRGPRGERRQLRRRFERALENPAMIAQSRDAEREAALRDLLEGQGVAVAELIVLTRPADPEAMLLRPERGPPRPIARRFDSRGENVVAGLKRAESDSWQVARVPRPPRNPRALAGLLFQTVILYVVLVGGLALLLRRITRPLAALTRRVESFGGTGDSSPPPEPSGPADTRRLIGAHNAMETRIAALLDEKDVMLGAIGHDLKTPLAALRVRIESVEDEAERARMAAGIEDITRTLDDILSLARVGRPSDPLERTDLAALIAGVVEEYEDMGEPVVFEASERVALPVRATWLRRALRNLVDNALRYGSDARVNLATEGDTAIVRIADSGPGIPEDRLEAMLEPFARGEASRNRATGGAGLGLTLARAIAEQHGGALALANASEGGVLAELRLPLQRQ